MIRCPVDDTGMNSVSPSTTPKITAILQPSMYFPSYLLAAGRKARTAGLFLVMRGMAGHATIRHQNVLINGCQPARRSSHLLLHASDIFLFNDNQQRLIVFFPYFTKFIQVKKRLSPTCVGPSATGSHIEVTKHGLFLVSMGYDPDGSLRA